MSTCLNSLLREILYGIFESPLGKYALFVEENQICALHFFPLDLKSLFPNTPLIEAQKKLEPLSQLLFTKKPFNQQLKLEGTTFQQTVWQALRELPFGDTISYNALAKKIGKPKATRAVANAVGKNRIAFLIPCHRIIYKSGKIGHYRWGNSLKQALLKWEKN